MAPLIPVPPAMDHAEATRPKAPPLARLPAGGRGAQPAKILVFDLFSGMGGCWHALNLLGIPPGPASGTKMIMFETDPPARALLGAKAGES